MADEVRATRLKGDGEETSPGAVIRDSARYLALVPAILGLSFCRVGILSGAYGSYESSDEGIFTDGAMLLALAVLLVALAYFWCRPGRLKDSAVGIVSAVCIGGEALSLVVLFVLCQLDAMGGTAELVLCAAGTLFGSGCMFCWLRSLRGCASVTAAVVVFSALAFSEVLTFVTAVVPKPAEYLVAVVFVLGQVPCVFSAHRRPLARSIASVTFPTDYFGLSTSVLESRSFLITNAVGIGFMGLVTGLLRGYPDGLPIPFTMPTRFGYAVLVILICAVVIACVLGRRQQVLTVGAFIFMEICAMCALLLYTLFPDHLEYGAVFATTLNAFMVGFVWYVTLAFMTAGWREPFYYACAGWIIWLGSRAVARVVLFESYQLHVDSPFIGVCMATIILVSAQVVLTQFLHINQGIAERKAVCLYCSKFPAFPANEDNGTVPEDAEDSVAAVFEPQGADEEFSQVEDSLITRIMGLDGPQPTSDPRQSALSHNAQEMGAQFMLSPREVEVLGLYALGYTQKKVAEVLCISPATAHAHIKRIYTKTGLHSRQEILDYIEQYTV